MGNVTVSAAGMPAAGRPGLGRVWDWLSAPIQEHLGALLAMNVIYLAAAAIGVVLAFLRPELQLALLQAAGQSFSPGGALEAVGSAYLEGRLLPAIVLTFAVNLILGSLLYITLPSLVLPFAGVLVGAIRGMIWGLLFAPVMLLEAALLWHIPTIVLEGEAYVVAMLGVWLWWRGVVTARGARWDAWRAGLRIQVRIYALVAVLLALAATYEVLEVVLIFSSQAPAA